MNRWLTLALAAALGALGVACGGNGGSDAGDAAETGPATDGGEDAADAAIPPCDGAFTPQMGDGGTCFTALSNCNMTFCPGRVVNNPMRPNFIITQIDVRQPRSLAPNNPVGRILNTAIADGSFFWGMSFDFMANTVRTGAMQSGVMPRPNLGFLESDFMFSMGMAPAPGMPNRWDPVTSTVTLNGETASSGMVPQITVPVFNASAGMPSTLLAELPLRNTQLMNVQMNSNRNCIGTTRGAFFNSCTVGQWLTTRQMMPVAGVIDGYLTVEDARNVQVPMLNSNLCAIISGRDCTMVPQDMWSFPPDARLAAGMGPNDAWHIIADFAAVSANIR